MTIFYFVRHGQTGDNLNRVATGRGCCPLNRQGEADAILAVFKLERYIKETHRGGYTHTVLYTSPVERAVETASYISKTWARTPDIVIDNRLSEIDFGPNISGRKWDDIQNNYPEVLSKGFIDTTIEGVEPWTNIVARVHDFIAECISTLTSHHVICVTHADIVRIAIACCSKTSLEVMLKERVNRNIHVGNGDVFKVMAI